MVFRLFTESTLTEDKRLRDVLTEMRNDSISALIPSGSSFAGLRAGSRLSETLKKEESWRGIDQILFLDEIVKNYDTGNIDKIGAVLESIRSRVILEKSLSINISASDTELNKIEDYIESLVVKLPRGIVSENFHGRSDLPVFKKHEALIIPAPVAYIAQSFSSSVIESGEYGSEIILSHILRTDYLWENVRMKGGAYGASAAANGVEGIFSFSSYRDPNIEKTLAAFREGLKYLINEKISNDSIEKAIITIVGRDVRPQSPGETSIIGFIRKLYNITDDIRRIRRKSILSVTAGSIKDAAARLLENMDDSAIVVMTGKERIDNISESLKELKTSCISLPQ
ncbi:MAG: insulinase family protein [Spirochaetales bacterium]|nr:insulinase family protein [Spirochaetales bacterium]